MLPTRRRFLQASLAAASLCVLDTAAQGAAKLHRIGFLWDTPDVWPHALEAFRQGLRDLGWIEGKNIITEHRWAEGRFERLPALVNELVQLRVEVIVAPTSIYTGAARRATSSIPIVFASHADPVGSGHVISLARPGTNATGLTIVMSETMPKSVELLKAAVPSISGLAIVWDPATPSHKPTLDAVVKAGRALGLRIQGLEVRGPADFDGAFAAMTREQSNATLVLSTPLFIGSAKELADRCIKHKVASMFGSREHVEAGGLMSYSPDRPDLYRRAASYVDQILKGANPAELPVQQASTFELAVNLKTASLLSLTIPQSMLVRADYIVR